MPPRVSACLIVKNEEKCLPQCLESIREAVDEIIVVDTGSHDNSKEIAHSFGAQVFSCPWEDDFSAPRNLSIEHARAEWILVIDADERLAPEAQHRIRQFVKNKNLLGFRVLLDMHPDWTPVRSMRLFRNLPGLRFKGVYHEELKLPRGSPSTIIANDLRIIHTPFTEAIKKNKYERRVTLLQKHLRRYSDDSYQMLDLAQLYLEHDAAQRAEPLLQQARELIFNCSAQHSEYKLNMCRALYYHLQGWYLTKKNSDIHERLAVYLEAVATLPRCPLFHYHAAHLYYCLHKYGAAIGHFQKCLDLAKQPDRDMSISYRRDILGSWSLSGLGYCCFREKKYADAIRFFELSLEYEHDERIQAMVSSSRMLAAKAGNPLSQNPGSP